MPFNIYEMSAWSRTIVIPLSLLWAFKPQRKLPEQYRIDELFVDLFERLPQFGYGIDEDAECGRNHCPAIPLGNGALFFKIFDGDLLGRRAYFYLFEDAVEQAVFAFEGVHRGVSAGRLGLRLCHNRTGLVNDGMHTSRARDGWGATVRLAHPSLRLLLCRSWVFR